MSPWSEEVWTEEGLDKYGLIACNAAGEAAQAGAHIRPPFGST